MYKKQDMVRYNHNHDVVRIVYDQELQLRLHSKKVHGWNVSHLGHNKVCVYKEHSNGVDVARDII